MAPKHLMEEKTLNNRYSYFLVAATVRRRESACLTKAVKATVTGRCRLLRALMTLTLKQPELKKKILRLVSINNKS